MNLRNSSQRPLSADAKLSTTMSPTPTAPITRARRSQDNDSGGSARTLGPHATR